mmetsp:Transcript_20071/g.80072  ORF Transcript_20071/g.80072 Transcript_20071/m.80072 type:complete len:205 (+) Transcript_20071:908-1522(+)
MTASRPGRSRRPRRCRWSRRASPWPPRRRRRLCASSSEELAVQEDRTPTSASKSSSAGPSCSASSSSRCSRPRRPREARVVVTAEDVEADELCVSVSRSYAFPPVVLSDEMIRREASTVKEAPSYLRGLVSQLHSCARVATKSDFGSVPVLGGLTLPVFPKAARSSRSSATLVRDHRSPAPPTTQKSPNNLRGGSCTSRARGRG